ncbi:MAG: TolC family protein [Rhodothermales bacterium]
MTLPRAARRALLACALPLGLAVSGGARAQAPDSAPLDLSALLAEVEAANPTLRAARLDAAALATVGGQVGVLPDPTVAVTAFPYPLVTALGAQRTQWRVEQTIPWPGTLALRERAADLGAEVAGYEADVLALDLALQVKRAYYTLYQIQRTEALVRSFRARLDAFTEAAAVRYEVGRGPQGAVLQVGLEEERLRARLLDLDARRHAALHTLAHLTNRPSLALADTVGLTPPPLPSADAALAEVARRLRPEVQALETDAERAEAEVALARKAFYPEIGVGVTYFDVTDRATPPTADGTDALAVMLSARVPLQRGRLNARLEEARLRQAEVEARQDALDTAISTEIAHLVHIVHREAETLALFRDRLVPQAQATVESVLAAYTTGEADYAAFLDAERTRFQVQLGLEDALGRYLDATARLERALGGAALADLQPSDSRLR